MILKYFLRCPIDYDYRGVGDSTCTTTGSDQPRRSEESMRIALALLLLLACPLAHGFVSPSRRSTSIAGATTSTRPQEERQAPRISTILASSRSTSAAGDTTKKEPWSASVAAALAACSVVVMLTAAPFAASAVSGGGLDFANLDLSGQDFSKGNYKGKDFTQVIAKATTFAGSNLQGCRFYKAYLGQTDFSGANLTGASLEDTSMDDADLKNVVAVGAYFSKSLLDAKTLENADFTDSQIPVKTLALLCEREDVKGTNPTTGADTRESLMCP